MKKEEMFQKEGLFSEQNRLKDRPEIVDVDDRLIEIYNLLDEFTSNNSFRNLSNCFEQINNFENVSENSLTANNLIETQILEALMDLCYRLKSPIKVLEYLTIQTEEFNLDSL